MSQKCITSEVMQEVAEYIDLDAQIKTLTAKKDKLNKKLKEFMVETGIKTIEQGDCAIVYYTQDKSSMDEFKLINRLKMLGFKQAVIKVEKVDDAKVTQLINEHKLSATEIEDCRIPKIVEALKVTKKNKVQA